MTLPATIRAVVDPQAITRVTRLFNGTLADAVHELLQNARRAGAARVEVETIRDGASATLVVRDDGCGIEDRAALLALGRSGWNADIAASEDPAGMGVFSLAGREVEVRSRPRGMPAGWRVAIPADAWESGRPLAIERWPMAIGTEIRITLPDAWSCNVTATVQAAALHYPLPVVCDGVPCARRDFLHDAVFIEEACGCRIGVFRDDAACERRLNFHGLQVACQLPMIGEVGCPLRWSIRIDVVDAPDLKLVLPARKEVVENDAVAALRVAAERATYRAIAQEPAHRMSFTAWARARDRGVELPPAEAGLPRWIPATADDGIRSSPTMVTGEPMLIVPRLEPALGQAARGIFRQPYFTTAQAVEAQDGFAGYAWYDDLPRIDAVAVLVHADGAVIRHDDGDDSPPELASGVVDDLQLVFALHARSEDDEPQEHRYPIDALVCNDGTGCIDEALILIRRGADPAPDRLADQIGTVLFHVDEDADSDSPDTQRDRFWREARATAIALLHGEDAADLDRIRSAFRDEVGWLIPAGRTVTIVAGPAGLSIDWATDRPVG